MTHDTSDNGYNVLNSHTLMYRLLRESFVCVYKISRKGKTGPPYYHSASHTYHTLTSLYLYLEGIGGDGKETKNKSTL